jgi:hypothetical protein
MKISSVVLRAAARSFILALMGSSSVLNGAAIVQPQPRPLVADKLGVSDFRAKEPSHQPNCENASFVSNGPRKVSFATQITEECPKPIPAAAKAVLIVVGIAAVTLILLNVAWGSQRGRT